MSETTKQRATYLLLSDFHLLEAWARELRLMFPSHVPYQVGSSLTTKQYRDVDVRLIVTDAEWIDLAAVLDIRRLNLTVTLWGQRVTGLPIDFQLQSMTDADVPEHGKRNALGLRDWSALA